VLRVPLPDGVRRAMAGRVPSSSASGSAAPSSASSPSSAAPSAGEDVPDEGTERPWLPWLLTGVVGLGAVAVLVRSLRPR
jgi:hypothetical protein